MGILSQAAGLYAALFVVSLFLSNYWLSLVVGFLGLALIVALALMLEDIDKTKPETEWVLKKISALEEEIKELKAKNPN